MGAYELTRTDKNKWVTNTLLFLAPVALIYLGYVQTTIADGFAWEDFIPNSFVLGTMILYCINVAIDIIKKFVQNGK